MFQNLIAVTLREVQVQEEKVRTRERDIQVQSVDESERFLAVGDYPKLATDVVFAERLAHESHIRGVILGQNNLAGCIC
jgi:hypothetical protein